MAPGSFGYGAPLYDMSSQHLVFHLHLVQGKKERACPGKQRGSHRLGLGVHQSGGLQRLAAAVIAHLPHLRKPE